MGVGGTCRDRVHLSNIRSVSADRAKALNGALYTVARCEAGWNEPTGLQEEVLCAVHRRAVETAASAGGLIALGIGALIFYLLTRDDPVTKTRPASRSTARRRKR